MNTILPLLLLYCLLQPDAPLAVAPSSPARPAANGADQTPQVGQSYFTRKYIDQIRMAPNDKAQIVCDISCGKVVMVVAPARHKWVKIESWEGDVGVGGYMPCGSLSKDSVPCKF